MTARRKRFYREVSIQAPELTREAKAGYRVLLDNKPLKTPAGAIVELPRHELAEAVANEWRAQDTQLRPDTMILTKLVNTAIDRVLPNPDLVVDQLVAFAKSELICYRAETPAELVGRQNLTWNPLIEWLRERFGAELQMGTAISFVEQKPEALVALKRGISAYEPFRLAAVFAVASLLGSLAIPLALAEGRLSLDDAFQAAQLDEIYQCEKWGLDPETAAKRAAKHAELKGITRFLEFLAK